MKHCVGISRRRLLGGVGAAAAAIALPILSTQRVIAQSTGAPRRLVIVFTPNGTIPEAFFPTGTETAFDFGPILTSLNAHKSKLIVLSGVHMSSTSDGPGSAHQKGAGHLLTGRRLLEGSFAGGGGASSGFASGISVDQHIANVIGAETKFASLEFGVRVRSSDVRGHLSYRGSNQPLPPMNDPFEAFQRMVGDNTGSSEEVGRVLAERRSILDFVTKELGRLNLQLDYEDRPRVEAHLEAIRDIERRLGAQGGGECATPELGPRFDPMSSNMFPEVGRLQMDLLTMALACDHTRVATLMWSNATGQQDFPWLGVSGAHHDISHEGDSNTDAKNKLIKINTWFAEQFAYLLAKLEAVTEGDRTLLDNTIVVWGNELGIGNNHTRKNIPWVLAGSAGGYFRTGRYLRYTDQPHNNLLVSLCQAMGLPDATFGDPKYCTGPFAELAG